MRSVVIELLLFVAIVCADAAGYVPLTQTILLLPLVWLSLHLRLERWSSIGFSRPENLWRWVALGILAGVALETLAVLVTTPWISSIFGVQPDHSDLSEIQGNITLLLIFLALSWTLAAFGEEICFRGFLMKRIAQLLGDTPSRSEGASRSLTRPRAAWILSLLLSSVLFGWGHTEQGVAGWIQEGLSGFLLGVLFLLARRNLTLPIVAHGVSNTVAFVLIYFGHYPGLP